MITLNGDGRSLVRRAGTADNYPQTSEHSNSDSASMYNQQLQFAPPATAEHATEDTVGLFRTVTSQPDAVNHRRSPAREINLPLAQVVPMLGQGRAALPTVALMEPAAEGRPPRVSPGGSYPVNGSTYAVSFMFQTWAAAQIGSCIPKGNCPSLWATAQGSKCKSKRCIYAVMHASLWAFAQLIYIPTCFQHQPAQRHYIMHCRSQPLVSR